MKLGLLGGSFNPIHNGHIHMAQRAKSRFGLNEVLFMVANDPPHKTIAGNVGAQTRLAMAEAGLAGLEGLAASGLELARTGKSYTVDTVCTLHEQMPGAEIYLIVGEDMLQNLPSWWQVETLLQLVHVIAVTRPGVEGTLEEAAQPLRARFGARISFAPFDGDDISSTMVRQRVFAAEPIGDLVPPGVERMIYELGLYQPEMIAQMQEKLRSSLNKKRYEHSIGTLRCALSLAARWGVNKEQARLAALLHDCARLPNKELLALSEKYGIAADGFDLETPSLLHDRVGAALARDAYGVEDTAVLDAICSHQLCRKDMTKLDKVIYLADKVEPTRDYPGVETLRALAWQDLDKAVLACMDSVYAHLAREGKPINPRGKEAWLAFRAEMEKGK